MQDCISQASTLTIYAGWGTWFLMLLSLLSMFVGREHKQILFCLVFVIVAHPILWGRISEPCATELSSSTLLFTGLWIAILVWRKIRPTLPQKES